jgi:uncharacterized protein
MSVYIDTSAFLSILNSDDPLHLSAVRTWVRLIDDQELIITTNYVVVETTALLQRRHGLAVVRRFAQDLLPVVLIEWVDPGTHSTAMSAILATGGKQNPSLVDCVSFEIIRKHDVRDVFAYDRHFADKGFKLIK